LAVVADVLHDYQGKVVFVVSHGDPLAFLYWQLLHLHENKLPTIKSLEHVNGLYLHKAEAWRVLLDEDRQVVEHEIVRSK
jgi:broad specificity phosphatase PhoE